MLTRDPAASEGESGVLGAPATAEATGNGARGLCSYGRSLSAWQAVPSLCGPWGLMTGSQGLLTFTPQVQAHGAQTAHALSSRVLPECLSCCPGLGTGERSGKQLESAQATHAAPMPRDRSKADARPAGREWGRRHSMEGCGVAWRHEASFWSASGRD